MLDLDSRSPRRLKQFILVVINLVAVLLASTLLPQFQLPRESRQSSAVRNC